MFDTYIAGAALAACASLFWTLAPFFFASAVRSLGAWRVNPLRLAGAAIILTLLFSVYALIDPTVLATVQTIALGWLAVSGIVGLVVGDALYLTSLGYLGPRRTLQILVLSPAVTALLAWVWLGERLPMRAVAGLAITLSSLSLATALENRKRVSGEPGAFSWIGFCIALGGTLCHGGAAVLARKAFVASPGLNPIAATSIRIGASMIVIWIWVLLRQRGTAVLSGLSNRSAVRRLGVATLLGPVLGMLCYVSAFRTAPAGVVSLLSSLSPVLIIPITAWRYRTPLNYPALSCMILAIIGVLMVIVR